MKKMGLILTITAAFFNLTAYASNQCIQQIDKHVTKVTDEGRTYTYKLSLKNCELQNRHMQAIVDFLRIRNDITQLDLSNNYLSPGGAAIFADSNLKLTWIDMAHNHLGDEGAAILSKVHGQKHFLEPMLNLSGNNISDTGAIALGENSTWSTLFLNKNTIGDAGVVALAQNTHLTAIYIDHNDVGNEGAIELARFVRINQIMNTIDIGWNHIGKTGLQALQSLKEDHIIWNLWAVGNDGE